MSADSRGSFEVEVERLQDLLVALDGFSDPSAREAARELVQAVIGLHRLGLADLLAIIEDSGTQPADTLLAKFVANPRIQGLLLLHGLHPEDLETRARKAVQKLRPHLGVYGIRAELVGVDDGVIRIRLVIGETAGRRITVPELRREIENAVLEMAPDALDVVIEGLEAAV
ncbi:MAG: hypothetical protein ACU843_16245, partial [Gammaproteobacteria bacterium]